MSRSVLLNTRNKKLLVYKGHRYLGARTLLGALLALFEAKGTSGEGLKWPTQPVKVIFSCHEVPSQAAKPKSLKLFAEN